MRVSGIAFFLIAGCGSWSAGSETRLPAGKGRDTLVRMCTGCHAVEVAVSNRHSKGRWSLIVQDMLARGARGSEKDIRSVVDYLAHNYPRTDGSPEPPMPPPAKPAPITGHVSTNFDRAAAVPAENQWPSYGHDAGGRRYAPLRQVTPENVNRLERVWTFHLGKSGSEATPLVINSMMYVISPDAIFALEPETGKLIWKYASEGVALRGLAYWAGGGAAGPRLYCGVQRGKLVALDALTGKPSLDFGDNGLIDLRRGVTDDPKARYTLASPPAIYQDIVITGASNGELSPSTGAYGDVRGWDARTGKLRWTFHTVPRPGEPGNETWPTDGWKNRSGTNVWGIMTIDQDRGLVYLPLGCPTSDMYGADRHGDGLYGNSLVALEAATGKVRWYRQLVHHDLWDYDLAAPPILLDVQRDGKTIPAVAQITKMSLLFIFDRTNGEPIFGLEERRVPPSKVPGEASSPTQPFPVKPPPLSRMEFKPEDLYDLTPEHAAFCRDLFEKNHLFTQGPYTPMPVEGNALTFPSTLGGGNWGGLSFDPTLGYAFTNIMNLGQWGHMEYKKDTRSGEMTWLRTAAFGGAYGRFWDPDTHVPCTKPPFGELVAVNVNTGDIAWRVPLGISEPMEAKGIRNTGTVNLGGSIATASGLVFIAASNDGKLRAFESRSGKELWVGQLDAPAYTVPITYQGRDSRQYVTVVSGGLGFWSSPPGDSVTAFALGLPPASSRSDGR
jgi:quinoprotein glucose dehydrogenase